MQGLYDGRGSGNMLAYSEDCVCVNAGQSIKIYNIREQKEQQRVRVLNRNFIKNEDSGDALQV